jgi:hypothetical protein
MAACNKKKMCDLELNTQDETKKWLLKNHPDKGGRVDQTVFENVVNCYKDREYCEDESETLEAEEIETASTDKHSIDKFKRAKIYTCMRQIENWSKILPEHKMDNDNFKPLAVKAAIHNASPKLEQLFRIIEQVDENDLNTHGKYFKHFIFSDVKEEGYGAKIVASAFIANGYKNLITARTIPGQKALKLTLLPTGEDGKNKGFGILSSSTLFNSEFSQKFKKEVLSTYNKRPDNIQGADMRFIILDSGFKEGIDLFDVKYVHIFEPSMTMADLKQTVGRATRTCGQKGLNFEPNLGWPLYVYNYYAVVPDIMKDIYKAADRSLLMNPDEEEYIFKNTKKFKDAVILYSEYDRTLTNLSEQLYKLAPVLAVDYELTKNIHKIDDIAYLYDTMNEHVNSSSSSSRGSSSSKVGGAETASKVLSEEINCKGKCGARSTKDVPASVKFLLYVYKKYGHVKANLPEKNTRAYLCAYMRENPDYCKQINTEWAKRVGEIPSLVTKKVENLTKSNGSKSNRTKKNGPNTSGSKIKSAEQKSNGSNRKTTRKVRIIEEPIPLPEPLPEPIVKPKSRVLPPNPTVTKIRKQMTIKNKKIYDWVKILSDEELEHYIEFIGIPIEKQPINREQRERLYIELLKDFIPSDRITQEPIERVHNTIKSVKNYLSPGQLENMDEYIENTLREEPTKEQKEEPVIQEPVIQEPVIQEPVIQEPVIQEPVIQEPVIQEPVIQEPVIQEPVIPVPVKTLKPNPYKWVENMTNKGLSQHIEFMGVLKSRQPSTRAEKEKLYLKLLSSVTGTKKTQKMKTFDKLKNITIKNRLKSLTPIKETPAPETENKTLVIANDVMQQLDIVPYQTQAVKNNLQILKYKGKKVKALQEGTPCPPKKKLNFSHMRDFIKTNFSKDFTWAPIVIENKCVDLPPQNLTIEAPPPEPIQAKEKTSPTAALTKRLQTRRTVIKKYIQEMETKKQTMAGGSRVLKLNNTQNFIKTFFTPKSPYKGLLLWHSVGTGKTCTAIATATASFDLDGYTILWVTRNTLKGDVNKNIFDDVCHSVLAEKMKQGMEIPTDVGKRNRLLGTNWIEPISYKTFSNLLTLGKHNKYLEQLIARNGKSDILKKTLIVIDEAHKLYGGDLKAGERPDMKVMEKLLQKSYLKSGKDSARLLIMTATPFTDSPMELFKLINLCKSEETEKIPTDIKTFKTTYMGEDNYFTAAGVKKIADKVSGYISYLNREQDPTQFAQPIMIDVPVLLTHIEDNALRTYYLENDNKSEKQQQMEDKEIEETKKQILKNQDAVKELKVALRENKKTFKLRLKDRLIRCKTIKNREEKQKCVAEITGEVDAEEIDEENKILEDIKELNQLIEHDETETKTLINNIKMYKKKVVEMKEGLLQEVMLNERCKSIKA